METPLTTHDVPPVLLEDLMTVLGEAEMYRMDASQEWGEYPKDEEFRVLVAKIIDILAPETEVAEA